eukprot:s638_g13.t1
MFASEASCFDNLAFKCRGTEFDWIQCRLHCRGRDSDKFDLPDCKKGAQAVVGPALPQVNIWEKVHKAPCTFRSIDIPWPFHFGFFFGFTPGITAGITSYSQT